MSPHFPGSVRPMSFGRWLLAGLLVGVLFWVGIKSEVVFAALTRGWQALFELLGLAGTVAHLQQGTSQLVTMRSLPAVGTYSLLYIGLCLLLLQVLLRDGRRTRWAALVYASVLGIYIVLLVVGRLGGSLPWVYNAGRRIIDFLISPLPVMVLLPILWPGSRQTARLEKVP